MKTIIKYAWGNIKSNKYVAVIIIFSLIISSAVLNLTLTTQDEVKVRYEALNTEMFQGYNIILTRNNLQDPFIDMKEVKLDSKKTDSILPINLVYGKFSYKDETNNVTLTGVDIGKLESKKLLKIDSGDKSSAYKQSKNKKAIISHRLAERYGYKVGDSITISTDFGENQFTISSIARENGIFMGQENTYRVVINDKVFEEMSGIKEKSTAVMLKANDTKGIDKIIEDIEKDNKDINIEASTLVDYENIEKNQLLMTEVLMIILVLSIFINIYVISSNTKRLINSRIPVIGTFRSIGCSKTRVKMIVMVENVIYALIGGGIGVLLSTVFKNTLISAFSVDVKGIECNSSINGNIIYAIVSIIFAFVLQLVCVSDSLGKTAKMPIKNLIIESPKEIKKQKPLEAIIWVLLLILSVVIMVINKKSNILLTFLSIILSMGSVFELLIYICSFITTILHKIAKKMNRQIWAFSMNNIRTSKELVESVKLVSTVSCVILIIFMAFSAFQTLFTQAGESFTADYQIYGMTKPYTEYRTLDSCEGVESVKTSFVQGVDVKVNDSDFNILLCGMRKADYGISDVEKSIYDLKNNEIMVDSEYAKKYDWKIGDKVEVTIDSSSNKTKKYTIVGTVNSQHFTVNRNVMVISDIEYTNTISEVPSTIYINANDKSEKVRNNLYKKISGENIVVQSYDEFIAEQESKVSGIFSIVWLIIILSLLLVMIGVVNNQSISFIQRKRELAVLYSVAMNKFQLKSMILEEIIFTFLISCICGLGWGAYMSQQLEQLLICLGMYINIEIPWGESIAILGGLFVCLLFTNIIPVKQINTMNVVNEIRYE